MKRGRVQAYVFVTKWLGLFVSGTLVSAWPLSDWCSISWLHNLSAVVDRAASASPASPRPARSA